MQVLKFRVFYKRFLTQTWLECLKKAETSESSLSEDQEQTKETYNICAHVVPEGSSPHHFDNLLSIMPLGMGVLFVYVHFI